MNIAKIADRTLEYSFYFLLFLVPLVMTPLNFELFEYNKMMLTYALTAIIVGAWLAKMIIHRKLIFQRTPFDIPLIIFFVFQFFSFLVSLDRHTSLWGYYSRFHGGLLSTISYLLLYFAFVSNMDKRKTLCSLRYVLCSATLVAIYGVLEHFGIDAQYWVQDVRNRVFSTLGQPNWLAAYLAALLPLPIALAAPNRKKKSLLLFYSFTLLLFLACLFFTQSRSGIPAAFLTLGFFFFLLLLPKIFSLKKIFLYPLLLFAGLALVGGLFWGLKKFPQASQDIQYILGITDKIEIRFQSHGEGGSPSSDIRKIVWRGAVDIFKHYPLFGSGVETFAYSYYQFRPPQHNLISEWDFLYNKAHNEYFNFLATTGAVGLGSYLLLIGIIIFQFLKYLNPKSEYRNSKQIQNSNDQNPKRFKHLNFENLKLFRASNFEFRILILGLFAGWASILVTNFFGFSVVPVALFFFLYPAMSVILVSSPQGANSVQPLRWNRSYTLGMEQWLTIVIVLTGLLASHYTLAKFWYADTLFAQADKANKLGDYSSAFHFAQRAIALNSSEPNYHDELAWSAANLAVIAFEHKQSSLSIELANLALSSSDKALSISPYHLNFLKTRTKIFYKLAQADANYLQKALETLLAACKLAPTDAKIFYNLGLVYLNFGQTQEALNTLKQTVQMKTNYREARYALALVYEQEGRKKEAIEQLEFILTYINPGNGEATQKLKELQGK